MLLTTGLMTDDLAQKTFSKLELFLYEHLSEILRIEENAETDRQKAILEERRRQRRKRGLWDE